MTIAAMVAAATKIDQAGTGYDQSQRWTFFTRPDGPINRNGEGDCSAVCGAIARLGGYPIDLSDNGLGGRLWTGTWKARALAAGFTAIPFTSLSQLRAGDFVLGKGHIEFVPEPGVMFSANADEHGRATGGQAGDQTGREVYFKKAYIYSHGGWQWILRPPADPKPAQPTAPAKPAFKPGPTLAVGSTGARVKHLQQILAGPYKSTVVGKADGIFGDKTKLAVIYLQRFHKLTQDGIVGPATQKAIYQQTGENI